MTNFLRAPWLALLLAISLLAGTAPSLAATTDATWQSDIAAMVADETEIAERRQISAAVIDADSVSYQGWGEGASADTVYEIGSISKVFTGILLARAVIEQKLTLDTTLAEALEDVTFASEAVAGITLRELATHTSGLPRLPSNMLTAQEDDPYAEYSRRDLMLFLEHFQADELDKTHAYSNLGFGLLGVILEQAFGEPYPVLVASKLSVPLNLTDTVVELTEAQIARLAPALNAQGSAENWNFKAMAGAGALRSTATDMGRFVRLHLDERRRAQLPQAERAALELAMQVHAEIGGNRSMGLGWFILNASEASDQVYWHGGGTGGYRSVLALKPAGNEAIAILSNGETDVSAPALSALGVTSPEIVLPQEAVVLDTDTLAGLTGTYRLSPQAWMFVEATDDGALRGRLTGQPFLPFTPLGDDRFANQEVGATLVFDRKNRVEKAGSVTLLQNGRELPAPRADELPAYLQYQIIELPPGTLQQYEGSYSITAAGADMVIAYRPEAQLLTAKLGNQPAIPIFAHAPDEFFYDVVDAQLSFERDDAGKVNALVLHQNGRDMRGARKDD